jgi:carboxyl-terminal processing protease
MGGRSAGEYFDNVLEILKEQFVDPIRDETPLAHGAVSSMLQSLRDPGTRFYSPSEWKRYLDQLDGSYEGLGADLAIIWQGEGSNTELPLTVVSVFDSGPGHVAGLLPGDVIEEVGGNWVASRSLLNDLGVASEKRQKGEISDEEYQIEFERLREKSLGAISINDALARVQEASRDPIELTVLRKGVPVKITVTLSRGSVDLVEKSGDVIRIRTFGRGVDARLSDVLPTSGDVTIDLRNNPGGSFEIMERCLAQLIPPGEYASIVTKRGSPAVPLRLKSGAKHRLGITVLVNEGTAREAELFAIALRDRANAKLIGGPTAQLGLLSDRYTLSDESGYTLTRGHFVDLQGTSLLVDRLVAGGRSREQEGGN